MDKINVSEFKATCLRLLEQVRKSGEPIEILKNGEPLAIVYPAGQKRPKNAFGAMKESLTGPLGDLLEPIPGVKWEALGE